MPNGDEQCTAVSEVREEAIQLVSPTLITSELSMLLNRPTTVISISPVDGVFEGVKLVIPGLSYEAMADMVPDCFSTDNTTDANPPIPLGAWQTMLLAEIQLEWSHCERPKRADRLMSERGAWPPVTLIVTPPRKGVFTGFRDDSCGLLYDTELDFVPTCPMTVTEIDRRMPLPAAGRE